jgi:hypothetical protein
MGLNSHVEIAKHCYSMAHQLLRQVLERERERERERVVKANLRQYQPRYKVSLRLQTTLLFHKCLQHFTAMEFLVHTRVTLAN